MAFIFHHPFFIHSLNWADICFIWKAGGRGRREGGRLFFAEKIRNNENKQTNKRIPVPVCTKKYPSVVVHTQNIVRQQVTRGSPPTALLHNAHAKRRGTATSAPRGSGRKQRFQKAATSTSSRGTFSFLSLRLLPSPRWYKQEEGAENIATYVSSFFYHSVHFRRYIGGCLWYSSSLRTYSYHTSTKYWRFFLFVFSHKN